MRPLWISPCSAPRDLSHNFAQQCVGIGKKRFSSPKSNPRLEDDTDKNGIASVAYRGGWKLGDEADVSTMLPWRGPSSTSKYSTNRILSAAMTPAWPPAVVPLAHGVVELYRPGLSNQNLDEELPTATAS